jgi:hypothetical protein
MENHDLGNQGILRFEFVKEFEDAKGNHDNANYVIEDFEGGEKNIVSDSDAHVGIRDFSRHHAHLTLWKGNASDNDARVDLDNRSVFSNANDIFQESVSANEDDENENEESSLMDIGGGLGIAALETRDADEGSRLVLRKDNEERVDPPLSLKESMTCPSGNEVRNMSSGLEECAFEVSDDREVSAISNDLGARGFCLLME